MQLFGQASKIATHAAQLLRQRIPFFPLIMDSAVFVPAPNMEGFESEVLTQSAEIEHQNASSSGIVILAPLSTDSLAESLLPVGKLCRHHRRQSASGTLMSMIEAHQD